MYDDEEDEKDNTLPEISIWGAAQGVAILTVLAIAIAVLVLAVRNRHLGHQAITIAQTADETAQQANGTANHQVRRSSMVASHSNI